MQTAIALLGGAGKSGQYIVHQLLQQGYSLRLLLRHPETFTQQHPAITLIAGDARDKTAVQALLQGCPAVVNSIGQGKGEAPLFREVTGHIMEAMQQQGITRYIGITGLSIDLPGDQKSEWVQQASAIMRQHFPATIADKQAGYEVLATSTVDWTLLRLPQIVQTEAQYGVTVNLADCPGQQISTTDLAVFIAAQLTSSDYIRKAPFIASAGKA